MARKAATEEAEPQADGSSAPTASSSYVTPILHVGLPSSLVDAGFWGGLVGAVALGIVDPPVGLLVGAGVMVARHRIRTSETA